MKITLKQNRDADQSQANVESKVKILGFIEDNHGQNNAVNGFKVVA